MNILLACSAGMSTSLLEKSILEHMKKNGIEGKVQAHASEAAKSLIGEFDIVMLGPQVRFMKDAFQNIAGDKPVAVINPMDYAMGDGEAIYSQAKELIDNSK